MQFEWDAGNWPKCGQHGVSQSEIEHVLSTEPLIRPDHAHSSQEPRFNAIGRNQNGRFIFIAFCVRGGVLRPISARFMRQKEVTRFSYD